MPNKYWCIFILFCIVSAFGAGVYVEHEFNLASLEKQAVADTTKAQTGENNIVQFHQEIKKVYVKAPCSDTPIPANTLKLLK